MKQTMRAMVLVLATAMLAGCGQPSMAKPTPDCVVPAPSAAPAPSAQAAAPAAAPAPAPAPVPASQPPAPSLRPVTLAADADLRVKRLVVAHGVQNREPVGAETPFKGDAQKVYAFVEVENKSRVPSEIVVEFEAPGGSKYRGNVTLAVGAAPRWRTWAYTRTASTAGSWTAIVKNRKGDVLARAPFEVTL